MCVFVFQCCIHIIKSGLKWQDDTISKALSAGNRQQYVYILALLFANCETLTKLL